jgi:hypothetical protein
MKAKLLTIGFSTVIVSLLLCSVVHASWSTLETGYAVTSNWKGPQIPTNTPVTITAGTLDSTVTSVTFKWLAPTGSGDYLLDETVPVYTNGTIGYWENGTSAEIRYANSTYVIYQGVWMVQILFNTEVESNIVLSNSEGKTNTIELWYGVGAIDYDLLSPVLENPPFTIPEIPLGTIGASVAMAAALGLFMIKKKRQQK